MPRYTVVNAPTFVGNNLHEIGAIVEYAGWPGSTLDPADELAGRVKEYFKAHRRDRKLPRVPDLAKFAESEPEKPTSRKAASVKDETDG